MGRNDHSSGFMARIGLLLVLLASLLAFNFENAVAADRMAPISAQSIDLDPNDDGPDPHGDALARSAVQVGNPFSGSAATAAPVSSDPARQAQWSYHFLVRGPPSRLS